MIRLYVSLLLVMLLSACAQQPAAPLAATGESESALLSTSNVGINVAPLPATSVPDYMTRQLQDLNQALADSESKNWQVTQLADGSIRVQTSSDAVFDHQSAELRPSVLDVCAKFAQIALRYEKTVIHIVANGRDADPVDYRQSLSDRRASAFAMYLSTQGINGVRLRYEGSAIRETNNLVILIRPMVIGAEQQAWMSPS